MINTIGISKALQSLRPKAQWSLLNDTDLDWHDKEQIEPTKAEIDAEVTRLQKEYDVNQYQRDRTYPSVRDQLDMQYHDLLDGTTIWKDAIAKVKSDNPKE